MTFNCEVFGAKFFDFFNCKRFSYFLKTPIILLNLIHIIFDGPNNRMIFVLSDD